MVTVRAKMILKISIVFDRKDQKYLFDEKFGVNFTIGAIMMKSKMSALWPLLKLGLIALEILNIDFVPTCTLKLILVPL